MDACYEEAAKMCPRGYAFLDTAGSGAIVIVPVGNMLMATRGPNSMLVECKD